MRIRRLLGSVILTGLLATGAAACATEEQAGGGPCDVKVSTNAATKPTITIPDCDPPKGLETRDVIAGTGAEAKPGDAVSVQYVGVAWSNKTQFDASWDRGGRPYTVQPLGEANVIQGWNEGLVGAKVGTRRLMVIPPDLGYSTQGNGDIKPNETLVFVVDVTSINGS